MLGKTYYSPVRELEVEIKDSLNAGQVRDPESEIQLPEEEV